MFHNLKRYRRTDWLTQVDCACGARFEADFNRNHSAEAAVLLKYQLHLQENNSPVGWMIAIPKEEAA